ncbi:MAG: YfhO family protein [Anaerolineae bacterium]|jgi:hypothetical protein
MSERRANWVAIGILLAAVLLLFAPALRHPNDLLYPTFSSYSDVTVIHWPKAHLMADTWQSTHTLPLWTPANLSGMPLAANQLAMCFYPPAWLFLLLPINPVLNLLFVFHLFWGGLGVYWLLRAGFDLDPIPALSGALTFALGGKLLAHAAGGHVSLVGAIAWMPWALLGTHQLLRAQKGRWGWAILAALALAMQITTHTLITLYTGYFLAAYVGWQLLIVKAPASNRRLLSLSLLSVPLLAALLGAAQLLPLIELAGYSNRALSLAQAGDSALTPLTLVTGLFLPDIQGGHEMVIYLGLVPLVLACFGLRGADTYPADLAVGRRRRGWFFGGVVLLAALFALGPATPIFRLVYQWLPGFRWVRTPARVFLPASLAVGVLAGMGMQRLARGCVRWSPLIALAVGAITLALGLGLATLFGQANRAALGLAFFPSLTLVVVGLTAHGRLPPRLALPGLALLLFADLASFDVTMIRFVSPSDAFAEGGAVAGYLAHQPGLFRTYSPSYSLPSHVAAQAGLQTADGVEPVHLAAYDRLMALAGGYGDPSFSVTIPPFPPDRPLAEAFHDTQPNLRLLGLLNVEYLVTAFPTDWTGLSPVTELDGTFVYRNEHFLPRAWFIEPPPAEIAQADINAAWVKQLAALADLAAQSVVAKEYSATVTHYTPDRIEVEAQLRKPGLLVLSEIWYPGWQVVVDGQVQPLEQVAGILRGVSLDKGTHRAVFVYNPASARWGAWLSLAGWIGIIVGAGIVLWRRRFT